MEAKHLRQDIVQQIGRMPYGGSCGLGTPNTYHRAGNYREEWTEEEFLTYVRDQLSKLADYLGGVAQRNEEEQAEYRAFKADQAAAGRLLAGLLKVTDTEATA